MLHAKISVSQASVVKIRIYPFAFYFQIPGGNTLSDVPAQPPDSFRGPPAQQPTQTPDLYPGPPPPSCQPVIMARIGDDLYDCGDGDISELISVVTDFPEVVLSETLTRDLCRTPGRNSSLFSKYEK